MHAHVKEGRLPVPRDPLQHPVFGRVFARLVKVMDRRGGDRHRQMLLAGLTGRVVEVGAGSGANFRHYPDTVTEVIAVEPDAYLRGRALAAARWATVPIRVVTGDAEHLPGSDAAFDTVVMSLVLCSVANPSAAVAEARRVLGARGELRFYEHVRSRARRIGSVQDALTPSWRRVAGGCHPNRDLVTTLQAAGWEVEATQLSRSRSLLPHVLGSARPVQTLGPREVK